MLSHLAALDDLAPAAVVGNRLTPSRSGGMMPDMTPPPEGDGAPPQSASPTAPAPRLGSKHRWILAAVLALALLAGGGLYVRHEVHVHRCAGYSHQYYAILTDATSHLLNPDALPDAFVRAKVVQDRARAAHCHVPDLKDAFQQDR